MMKWALVLSEYGLVFESRGLVRPQVLVDFGGTEWCFGRAFFKVCVSGK